MNKRYHQYLLGGLFILIATVILVLFNKKSPSVEQIPDTLTKQQQIDLTLSETIEQGNYTFNNPYLILNPYESSPLTALMAFNTEDSVSVRVTILGKDEHSNGENLRSAWDRGQNLSEMAGKEIFSCGGGLFPETFYHRDPPSEYHGAAAYGTRAG